ncbi:hypothetical protein IID24_01670 [Patescibacteria group bacterium]|nr:hypothetical protein [Patescibacteria group bacterium]
MEYDDIKEQQKEEFEEGQEEERNIGFQILRAIVALAVIVGFVYISGVYQYLFYQRTPSSVEQQQVESEIDAQNMSVPLIVFVMLSDGPQGSERSEEDVRRLIENADRVWEQANIDLKIKDIIFLEQTEEEIGLLFIASSLFIQNIDEFDPFSINVFLLGNLNGLNGIAFGGLQTVAVADYTTVYDFRALAHEIGHVLDLGHIKEDTGRLMYQGANGFTLSLEEIMRARKAAEQF